MSDSMFEVIIVPILNDDLPECSYGYISNMMCDYHNSKPTCNASITCSQYYTTTVDDMQIVTPKYCDCSLDNDLKSTTSEPELITDDTVTKYGFSRVMSNSSHSTIIAALGALVGLFIVLLVIVSTVLAWTCWLLKRREGMKFNTEYEQR